MGSVRRLAALVAVLAALASWPLVAGLGGSADDAPARELVIVSPHWEGIRWELGRAFEREMAARGERVRVTWLTPGGTSAALRFVTTRFAEMPDGIGADLFFGGGVEPHLELARLGLTRPLPLAEATLAALPAEVAGVPVYDAAAGWYGTCLTTFGIVYNRALLARLDIPEPAAFADLGEPGARTWVGLADPRMSGSVHMIYELILQAHGFEDGYRLLARMAANARTVYHHAAEVPIEVGAGEVALGTSLDSYAWAQVAELGDASIGFVAPDGETVMNPDAIAALAGAPSPDLAAAFVEFVLSPAGQALWMLPPGTPGGPERYVLGRLPVRPDVWRELGERSTVRLDPFADRRLVSYDPALGSARWSALNGLLGTALIDLHRELASAWREVIAAGRPAQAERLLTEPPASAAELAAIAAGPYLDPIRRNEVHARWAREALDRYARAAELARRARDGRG